MDHLQKPKITEIQVRMDCNGCVQKIKKALHGINGIYDVYIDFPTQKLTIIGWADPERIVKAIRKTRKIATICSHTEQPDPAAQPTDPPPPEEGAPPPAPDAANPPPTEAPPAEPPKDQPPPENPQPHPPENPPLPPQVAPSQIATDTNAGQPARPNPNIPVPRGVQEAYVTYHHPSDYSYKYCYNQGYDGYWNRYPREPAAPFPPRDWNGYPQEPAAPIPPSPGHWNGYPQEPAAPVPPSPGHWNGYPREPAAPVPPSPGHWNGYPREPAAPVLPSHGYPREPAAPVPPSPKHWNRYPQEPAASVPPSPSPSPSPNPIYVTHSYNTYRPSPYVTAYENLRSPPRQPNYSRNYHYSNEYHDISSSSSSNYNNGNGNITSMFSDENPNACTII